MNALSILWWCGFFVVALYVQWLVPGLDALVIGLILVLQERCYKNLLWLLPLLLVMQEGAGSREFGGIVIWYAAVIAFFMAGQWLFKVESILFVLLLSVCMGSASVGIVYMLAPLQGLQVDVYAAVQAGLLQAIFVPCAWWLAYLSRKMTQPLGMQRYEQAS